MTAYCVQLRVSSSNTQGSINNFSYFLYYWYAVFWYVSHFVPRAPVIMLMRPVQALIMNTGASRVEVLAYKTPADQGYSIIYMPIFCEKTRHLFGGKATKLLRNVENIVRSSTYVAGAAKTREARFRSEMSRAEQGWVCS